MSSHRLAALSCAVAVIAVALVSTPAHAAPEDVGPGVYLRLAEAVPLGFDETANRLEETLVSLGWEVLPPLDCGVNPSKCAFRSRVITATHPLYVDRIMEHGPHAAFAAPIRFGVFEDEWGVHVVATNPGNLNRTIVDEATTPDDWSWAVEMIRDAGRTAFPDHVVEVEYGQRRERARIGRTMGVMAGGPFVEKLDRLSTLPAEGTSPKQIADLVAQYMTEIEGDWDWEIQPIYVLHLPEHSVSIVGVSGTRMEAKAFDIVGSGGDDARKDLACPGIDHAPAFPIEILFAHENGEITVSIEDEIRTKVQAILN